MANPLNRRRPAHSVNIYANPKVFRKVFTPPTMNVACNSGCNEVCADLDLVRKCAVDGALRSNLDQLLALCFVQWTDQFNAAQNAVNHRLWILTVGTHHALKSDIAQGPKSAAKLGHLSLQRTAEARNLLIIFCVPAATLPNVPIRIAKT
jgi:hypothetical protein